MSNYETTGWFINEWLRAMEMSQADFAKAAGWSRARVSMMCSGERGYSKKTLEVSAAVLGITKAELFMSPSSAFKWRKVMQTHHDSSSSDTKS